MARGHHDIGGLPGAGPIDQTEHQLADWEILADAVNQALGVIDRVRPHRAYLTHMCHDLPHAATCARLPAGVELAYDGLTFEIAL